MPPEPLHRLPDEVTVRLEELRTVVRALERVVQQLAQLDVTAPLKDLDSAIGSMVWWLWEEVRDVDQGGDS